MRKANKLVSTKRPFSHHTNNETTVGIKKQETQKKTNLSRRTLVKGKKSSLALNESKKRRLPGRRQRRTGTNVAHQSGL